MNGSAMHGFLAHGQDANSSLNAYPLAFLQSNVPVTLMTMTKLASKAELSNKAIAPLEGTAAGSLLNYGSLTQIPMPYGHVANNPSSTLPPAHFPFVAMPMTPPALSQGLSERIQWMEKVGLSSMRLNLNPPQLGNLQVVVTVNDANQGAHVQFLASTPQMVQTLTNHFSDLRDQLATFGFNNMSFDCGIPIKWCSTNEKPQNYHQVVNAINWQMMMPHQLLRVLCLPAMVEWMIMHKLKGNTRHGSRKARSV